MRRLLTVAAVWIALCSPATAQPPRGGSRWLTVSYGALLDPDARVRTGETLRAAMSNPGSRAAVQPFADPYSNLLPVTVDLAAGLEKSAFQSAVLQYPAGARQPAWAAILRGGRIHVATDGARRARVFLPADEPRAALRRDYPVVRHCLAGLLPPDGGALSVEVFAYHNTYSRAELRLNLVPYAFESRSFPPDRRPLDLAGLDAVLGKLGKLDGASLSPKAGLVLVGADSAAAAGAPRASLADLAVAYRASFHAGDNEAFVSLDPHPDPTKVTVNFGGFLEDTRLGAVVLEADRRFKTITTGLDPTSMADLRPALRERLPTFLSSAERVAAEPKPSAPGRWVGTRLWFYPESITVESDPEMRYALVTRPFFTADAERQRSDFRSASEFQRQKRRALPLGIAQAVAHLNRHYAEYAEVFPEFRDLETVARLMAVATWLRRASPAWLDLDGLLAVELPERRTARELTQLVSATRLPLPPPGFPVQERFIQSHSTVTSLTPILARSVGAWFGNAEALGRFFAAARQEAGAKDSPSDAPGLFAQLQGKPVRDLLRTRGDLQAFARVAAGDSDPGRGERLVMDVCGGVNLAGGEFRIRKAPASSALRNFRERADAAEAMGRGVASTPLPPFLAGLPGETVPAAGRGERRPQSAQPPRPSPVPPVAPKPTAPIAAKTVVVPWDRRASGGEAARVQGRWVGADRLVFSRIPE